MGEGGSSLGSGGTGPVARVVGGSLRFFPGEVEDVVRAVECAGGDELAAEGEDGEAHDADGAELPAGAVLGDGHVVGCGIEQGVEPVELAGIESRFHIGEGCGALIRSVVCDGGRRAVWV